MKRITRKIRQIYDKLIIPYIKTKRVSKTTINDPIRIICIGYNSYDSFMLFKSFVDTNQDDIMTVHEINNFLSYYDECVMNDRTEIKLIDYHHFDFHNCKIDQLMILNSPKEKRVNDVKRQTYEKAFEMLMEQMRITSQVPEEYRIINYY